MRITIQAAVMFTLYAIQAFAAGTGALPWEQPMTTITNSVTGPVAFGVGVVGLAVSGGMLLFHGDLNEFGRRGCLAGVACSVLTGSAPFLTNVFKVTGGLI